MKKEPPARTEKPMQRNRILVVDDEEAITLLLQKILMKNGYQVEVANSATYAQFLVNKQKYHIVLSDIKMPEMDGLELLKEVRQRDPLIQVVMMTSGVRMSKTLTALELGAADFIMKPLDMEEVLLIVDQCGTKLKRWQDALLTSYHLRMQTAEDHEMAEEG